MTTSEEQLQEWEALVPKLNDDADDHMDVAHSADMRPEHTANYRHAKNAHEAAYAIHSLIADLREAREQLASPYMDGYEAAKEEYRPQVIALEANLAEAQAREKEIRIAVEFVLKAFQASEAAGYRSRDRQFCIEILSKTLEEQQDQSALTAAIDTAVAPHLQKLAELESKIEFQNNELVEKQQYILSLERKLSAWGQNVAKLDAVMLEFCPDEMTDEQLAAWGEAQERVPDGGIESLTQEGRNDNSHD